MPRNNHNLALGRAAHHQPNTTIPLPGGIPPQSPSAGYEHRALPPVPPRRPPRPPRPPQGLGLKATHRMSWQSGGDGGEANFTRQRRVASVDESRMTTTTTSDIAHPVPRKSADKILRLTGMSLGHDVVSSPRQCTPPLMHTSRQKTEQLMGAAVGLIPHEPSDAAPPPIPPKSHRRSMPEQRARKQTPDSGIPRLSADAPIMSQPSTCSCPNTPPSRSSPIPTSDSTSPLQQPQTPPREQQDAMGDQSHETDVSRSSSPSATSSVYSDDDNDNGSEGEGDDDLGRIAGPLVGSPAPGPPDPDEALRQRRRSTGPDPLIKEFDLFARDLDRYRYSVAKSEGAYEQGTTIQDQSTCDYTAYDQGVYPSPDEDYESGAYAPIYLHPPSSQVPPPPRTGIYRNHTNPPQHSRVPMMASREPASAPNSPAAAGQASDQTSMGSSLESRRGILHGLAPAGTPPQQPQGELHGSDLGPYDDEHDDEHQGENQDSDEDEEDMLDLYHATAKEAAMEAAKEEAAKRASREATVAAAEAAMSSKKSRKGLKGLSTRMLQGTLPRALAPLTPPPGDLAKPERQGIQAGPPPSGAEEQVSMFEMEDDDEGSSYLSRVLRWPASGAAGGDRDRDRRDDDHAKRFPGTSTASSHSQRDGALAGLMSSALKSAGLHTRVSRRRGDMRGKIRVMPEGGSL